mgnify:CR=1 FL=1
MLTGYDGHILAWDNATGLDRLPEPSPTGTRRSSAGDNGIAPPRPAPVFRGGIAGRSRRSEPSEMNGM